MPHTRRCCGCAKASALPARGPCASRTDCLRSASVFQRLTKCETGVGHSPSCGLHQSLRHAPTNFGRVRADLEGAAMFAPKVAKAQPRAPTNKLTPYRWTLAARPPSDVAVDQHVPDHAATPGPSWNFSKIPISR